MTIREINPWGLLPSIILVLACASTHAADIHAVDFGDAVDDSDGTCTLREAIRSANGDLAIDACTQGSGGDRILLAAGTYTLDLAAGSNEDAALDGDLDLLGALEIRGVSRDDTVIDGVSEQSTERVFHLPMTMGAQRIVIRSLRLTGGSAVNGAGIRIDNGAALTVMDTTVDGSRASDEGGGIHNTGTLELIRTRIEGNEGSLGAGIYTQGSLTASAIELVSNVASVSGGGLACGTGTVSIEHSTIAGNRALAAEGGGVAIVSSDEFDLFYSRIENNEAVRGGGLTIRGGGTYRLQHSALIDNMATERGGALYIAADVAIRHSTLTGNAAPEGGGAYVDTAMALLDFVTVAANSDGGGLFNEQGLFLENSLLAQNEGGNCRGNPPMNGSFLNLDDGATCQLVPQDPNDPGLVNLVNTDPLLEPLADNGGPTPTFALASGSPAIDAASSAVRMNCELTPDQRGYARGRPGVDDGNGQVVYLCDLGAYERHLPYLVDSVEDTADADPADGACLTVNGTCSLRAAIQQANATPGLEEIELPAGSFALTLAGALEDEAATGDLDVLDPIVITGAGMEQTSIDGQAGDRVFDVLRPMAEKSIPRPKEHRFQDLAIRNGMDPVDGGAGMRIGTRTVQLERTVLADNVSAGSGGALRCERGCALTVLDSRLTGNRASFGGAVAMPEDATGRVTIERSELSGNTATIGGGALAVSDLALRNSTVSGNHAEDSGDDGRGGGIRMGFGVIENSTVANNSSAAGTAGGVFLVIAGIARNSLVAGNLIGGGDIDNCDGNSDVSFSFFSFGHNLADGPAADCRFKLPTDLPAADPLLGTLADNDGPTRTHALLPGSPAIDAGDDSRCPLSDQRDFLRPGDGDGDGTASCDIGAFEALSPDLAIAISDAPDPVTEGNEVTYTVTVVNNGPGSAGEVAASIDVPAPLTVVSTDAGAASCSDAGGTIDCALGEVAAGASFELTIVATADDSGSVTVTASVTGGQADDIPSNDTASETTTVNGTGGGGSDPAPAPAASSGSGGGAFGPLLLAALLVLACGMRSAGGPRWSRRPWSLHSKLKISSSCGCSMPSSQYCSQMRAQGRP